MRIIRNVIFFLVFIITILNTKFSFSQGNRLYFKHITFQEGLPFAKTCRAILQDSKGFIWFGSDVGLHRFDGSDFKNYYKEPTDNASLNGNSVDDILEDQNKNLWLATSNGLDMLKTNVDSIFHIPLQLDDNSLQPFTNRIRGIQQDKSGNIFVYTYNDIYQVDNQNNSLKRIKTGYDEIDHPSKIIRTMYIVDNLLFVAFTGQGFLRFNFSTKDLSRFSLTNGLNSNNITQFYKDSKNRLWIGSDKDVNVLESNGIITKNICIDAVCKIAEDNDGNIWLATDNEGLKMYDGTNNRIVSYFHNEDDSNSLNSNKLTTIFIDRKQNLWVVTNAPGLSVVNLSEERFFKTYTSNTSKGNCLSNNAVNAFAEDNTGNIWIGTDGGGLDGFNRITGKFSHFQADSNNPNSLSSNSVLSLFIDSDQILWVGTYGGGLCRFDLRKQTFTIYKNKPGDSTSISGNDIWAIKEDKDGQILALTISNGINIFNKQTKQFKHIYADILNPNGLSHNGGTALLCDNEGYIWVGTFFGLNRWNTQTGNFERFFHNTSDSSSISSNSISCIFEDSQKNIWIGTEDGLNLFKRHDKTFKKYTTIDGLPNNCVNSIIEDNNGNLWCGTNSGISKLNITTNSFENFGYSYGLPGKAMLKDACLKTKSGDLYFGGTNGFTHFTPHRVVRNNSVESIYITDLKIFDHSIKVGEKVKNRIVLSKNITDIDRIELTHNENSFSLVFAALDFANQGNMVYYYKMEGFDNDWRQSSSQNRTANYTNLSPDNYIFKVKAINNLNHQETITIELQVKVLPPWWKTWWAYLIYLSIIVGLFSIYFKLQNRSLKLKTDLFLEKVQHEKDFETNRIKVNFFTNITHEFRTPLTLIIAPIENLITEYPKDNFLSEQLSIIKRSSARLLGLINEILDLRKLDEGSMTLKSTENNLMDFISEIAKTFEMHSQIHKIQFDLNLGNEPILLWFDKTKMEKVIYNLLSNAFKFTSDGGSISISANTEDDDFVKIDVVDNGIGISPEAIPKIFDRFFNENDSVYSSGIGLSLCKELIELHKGRIEISSQHGKGSCFSVYLKKGKGHLKPEEIGQLGLDAEWNVSLNDLEKVTPIQTENSEKTTDSPILLLVDDNDELRHFVSDILKKTYQVIEAVNGKQAWDVVQEKMPDLVISDVMMPEMDGIELCSKIKNDISTCHIPVILLTARSAIEQRIEGLESGADSYIPKPFHPNHLKVRIQKLIENRDKIQAIFKNQLKNQTIEKRVMDSVEPKIINILSVDEKFMQRAIAIVERHISEQDFTIDIFASEIGMNYFQLYRKIKALTNITITDFILNIRLKAAASMIFTNKYTMSEICYEVGFTSPSYFSKCFKEVYGLTPSEYKEQNKV